MKIAILTGVMIMGTPVFPTIKTGTGKNEKDVPTIVDVDEKVAKELVLSKQAKVAPKGAKANFEVKPLEKEEDDLDAFFGDEETETDPEE